MSEIGAVSIWIMLSSYIYHIKRIFSVFRLWPHFTLLTTVYKCWLNKSVARINRFTSGFHCRWAVPDDRQKRGMALGAIKEFWWAGSWVSRLPNNHQGHKIGQFATITPIYSYDMYFICTSRKIREKYLENFAKSGILKGAAGGFLLLISCCRVRPLRRHWCTCSDTFPTA